MNDHSRTTADRLRHAEVLVEIGWLHDAELAVAEVLDQDPSNLDALSLFAKVKHMRGELSQAIACWAEIHATTVQSRAGLMQLSALLHLADDPESGATEFVAVGQQLARKPVGQLALEEAFRLFRAGRPGEARSFCVSLAAKHRGKDPQLYKLAVLAMAWIAELSGDLSDAAEFLERLGKERGFETDTDRLLALARVYEQLGSRDRLEAAVKIIRHLHRELEKSGARDILLLSRLAGLHRRLGNADEVAHFEAAYLDAYRRHAHRPTFAETLEVASVHYLPLTRLEKLRFPSTAAPEGATPRQLALAQALTGKRDVARKALRQSNESLDRKYLADLSALDSDPEQAAALYLAALEEDPGDLLIATWLLDHHARSPSEAVHAYFATRETFELTRDRLREAIAQAPLRPSLWRQLATLYRIVGDSPEEARCVEHAATLTRAAREKVRPIGRVLSASVYHFIGRAKGLIHELWAHRHPVEPGKGGTLDSDRVFGNITPEMNAGVRNTFVAVREYARTKFPQHTADILDYEYSFKVPKEDEPSGGLSAGLPSGLAFLSVFLQRPVPQDIALSGVLVADAHDVLSISPVGEAEYKVNAAYQRNLRAIILPRANAVGLAGNAIVPRDIYEPIVLPANNFDEAAKLVFGPNIFVPQTS